jgi:GNAT superfamily N-acetyltransferase
MDEVIQFYCRNAKTVGTDFTLPTDYRWRLWRPADGRLVPPGIPLFPFGVWTAMHRLHMFANREYGLFVVYAGTQLVHRSGIFPRYLRFPFMASVDLQIGDVWTHPEHRGRGLASFAIQEILAATASSGRRIWYLVDDENRVSVRTIATFDFASLGTGRRVSRWGLRALGHYVMTSAGTSASTRR